MNVSGISSLKYRHIEKFVQISLGRNAFLLFSLSFAILHRIPQSGVSISNNYTNRGYNKLTVECIGCSYIELTVKPQKSDQESGRQS